jgi:hypothetical protein
VEEIFGWLKTVGGMRKPRFIGQGYNLLSIANYRRRGSTIT